MPVRHGLSPRHGLPRGYGYRLLLAGVLAVLCVTGIALIGTAAYNFIFHAPTQISGAAGGDRGVDAQC
jgi:hypothetical protein